MKITFDKILSLKPATQIKGLFSFVNLKALNEVPDNLYCLLNKKQ